MGNVVNPLIFRSKYFPIYKNRLNVFYSSKNSIYPLLIKSWVFGDKRSDIIVNTIEKGNKDIFFIINIANKNSKTDVSKLLFSKLRKVPLSFNCKFMVFKTYSKLKVINFIMYYITERLIDSKTNIRKLLTQIAFLLINEYNLSGVKCVISGRIKGVQRAKKEVFKLGDNSVSSIIRYVKYYSSYIITKYGKLGIKLWLFM